MSTLKILRCDGYVTGDGCYDVPVDKVNKVIMDTCLIAYMYPKCLRKGSRKFLPGKTVLTEGSLGPTPFYAGIRSIHTCNDHEGGPQLNVDLTTYVRPSTGGIIPNFLETYDNVCTCVNVPHYIQNMIKWSLDNDGNSLYAYFELDCNEKNWHWKPVFIEVGHWRDTWEMHNHKRNYRGVTRKIQSLGPDKNSTYFQLSCTAYHDDKIMALELLEILNTSSTKTHHNLNETQMHLTTGANDDILHFFANNDFQGYHFGSRSTSKCNNFPEPVKHRWVNGIGSISTKVCVLLYSALDCMERSVKIEAPGTHNLTSVWESTVTGQRTLSLLYTQHRNWKWETKSYRVCNKEEGGSSLQVDILSTDPTVKPVNGPVILESYPHLCICRNVPEYIQQLDKWFINNHGNALVAYFFPDCSSTSYSPLWIPAGQSSYSFGLGSFKHVEPKTGIIHKIQSFGPDPSSGYFQRSCNNSSKVVSIFGQVDTTKFNTGSICDSGSTSESTLVGMLMIERMQALISEFQQISRKVDELKQMNQQTGFNFENVKTFFEGKLQQQRDEFKNLQNKIKDDLNDLFA